MICSRWSLSRNVTFGLLHLPAAFDVDVLRTVDQDVADRRVLEQHLQRAEAEGLVEDLVDQPLPLVAVEQRVLRCRRGARRPGGSRGAATSPSSSPTRDRSSLSTSLLWIRCLSSSKLPSFDSVGRSGRPGFEAGERLCELPTVADPQRAPGRVQGTAPLCPTPYGDSAYGA